MAVIIFLFSFQNYGTSFLHTSEQVRTWTFLKRPINSVSFIYSCKVHKTVMVNALYKSAVHTKHEETKAQTFLSHKRLLEVKCLVCFSLRRLGNVADSVESE